MPTAPSYSGYPLATKLGFKASSLILLVGARDGCVQFFESLPEVVFESSATNLIPTEQQIKR